LSHRGARLGGRVPGTAARRAQASLVASMSFITLSACSDLGPTPRVDAVTPAAAYSDVPVNIIVDTTTLRAGLVVDVDGQDAHYDDGTIHMALVGDDPGLPPAVDLGTVYPLAGVTGGSYLVTVPAYLRPGAYGLRITPPNGHSVIGHGAFQCLGPDTVPPVVNIDSPQAGTTFGLGDNPLTVVASFQVDDGFGQLATVNWSTANYAMGSCALTPLPVTGASPRQVSCVATFAVAPLDPAYGLGVPFWFRVDATDAAGNIGSAVVNLTVANLPKIVSFDRAYGSLEGHQPITIHGAYFTQDAKAYVDVDAVVGSPPDNRVGGDVRDSGTIVGFTPRGDQARDVAVSVKTLAGVAGGPYPFRYTAPPKLRLIQPASGPAGGGVLVTVAGNDLLDGVTISFGATYETSVPFYNASYSSSDKVVGCLPAGTTGIVNVWATDSVTGVGELAGGFTYVDPEDADAAMVSPACQMAGAK